MRLIFTLFSITFALMAGPTSYAAEGDNHGKPFQELQAAVDAALAAEEAARKAADAALAAAIAAEQAARVGADLALQAEIDANESALLDLEERVSVLESLHLTRSITWVETANFDVKDLASAIAGLNYQSGDWIFFVSRNAQTGIEFGNCTNQPQIAAWLNAAASESTYDSGYITGSGSYFYYRGSWYGSAPFRATTDSYATAEIAYQFMQIFYYYDLRRWRHFVSDRKGYTDYAEAEVFSSYNYSNGLGIGNTLTINVDAERVGACGF